MHLQFKHLLEISEQLRGESGCPWDRDQTLESLTRCVREEAEELCEAIEKKDRQNTLEEIGDLLFTLVLMAQIAKEEGSFDMGDVLEAIAEKLISRHTWVFGKDQANTPEEALQLWMQNKAKEKKT